MDSHHAARIIVNDLDSLVLRIEALPAHEKYTDALIAVTAARDAVRDGATDLHHSDMKQRFAGMGAAA